MRKELANGGGEISCVITTIEDICKKFGIPQFIKIDVEGFEVEVINGAPNIIFNERTIWMIEVRKDTKKKVFNSFIGTHQCYVIDNSVNLLIQDSSIIPDFANLLFIPKNHNE